MDDAVVHPIKPNPFFDSVDAAKQFLNKLCDQELTVHVSDGRKLVGRFLCTDNAANIVLGSCTEYPSPADAVYDKLQRNLMAVVIPGRHIKKIEFIYKVQALLRSTRRFFLRAMDDRRKAAVLYIFYVVATYWAVSISLVFLNKWLLSNRKETPDAPLFITWFQCVVTGALCAGTSHLATLMPNRVSFPHINFCWRTAWGIMPLSFIFVAMVSFNNLCLKHLNVSFYYLARSLTTVFNVIFTYFILHVTTSRKALICCVVIVIGYASGINIEGSLGSLSFLGVFFGVGSSVFVALNSIWTAKSLPLVEGSVWRLTFYNNFNAFFLFIPAIVLSEGKNLIESPFLFRPSFWFMMALSGLLGFSIGYVSALQIQVTSPLTHNVSGTAKAAAQTILAVAIYHEVKSVSWWMSNLVVLLASAAYAYVRHSEAMGALEKSERSKQSLEDKRALLRNSEPSSPKSSAV